MAKWTGILMAGQQRVTTVAMKRDKHGNILEYKMEPELDAMKSIQPSPEEWQEIFKRERERLALRSKASHVRCGDKYVPFDIDDDVFDATENCQSVMNMAGKEEYKAAVLHDKIVSYGIDMTGAVTPPKVGNVVKVSPEAEEYWRKWVDENLAKLNPKAPKLLPKGATRHKALPAACLEPLDDRAAFIGRWEPGKL